MNKIIYSEFQKAIFQDINSGIGNTIIVARAGSSKTFSLVEGAKYIPKGKKAIFVAFNSSIAKELREKINKSYIEIRTIHSKSFETVKNHFGKIAIDPNKSINIAELFLFTLGYKKFEKNKFYLLASIGRAINLCKSGLIDTPSKIDKMMDDFDIDTFNLKREDFVKTICHTLKECKKTTSCVDYGDMVWMPFIFNLKPKQYDMVFVDEVQDLCPAQINFALSLCKPGGRIIAAGDPDQVLYGFNAVDIDVIEKLQKRLNAKILTLPISYRCSKNVIKLAQIIVPDIQAAPNAKEGSVQKVSKDIFLSLVKPGDFILSRFNAPLIYYCLELLKNRVPANMAGRDIAKGLRFLINKSDKKTTVDFLQWLNEWEKEESTKLRAKNREPILIQDKAECLRHLCENKKSTDQVLDVIKDLFTDEKNDKLVICSSIHRSKGLERDRVFVLDFTLRKGMNKEEDNIAYVAWTRAKSDLFLVVK